MHPMRGHKLHLCLYARPPPCVKPHSGGTPPTPCLEDDMTCHNCRSNCKKFGRDRKGNQRFQCRQCRKTYSDRPERLEGSRLPHQDISQIVRLLVEGVSVRSTERITGVHRDTILNILVLVGERCEY